MFILGLLSHLSGSYKVRSNRESGKGRPDLLLIPLVQHERFPGIVMQLKVTDAQQQLQQAAQVAFEQIQQKEYTAEFHDHPPSRVLELAIAFCGKKVAVTHRVIT